MGAAHTITAVFEAVDNMSGTVEKIGSSLQNVGQTMQKVGGIMSATVTAPLAILGKQSIDTALSAERLTLTLGNLAGGAESAAGYIKAIQDASQGTVSEINALEIANRALSFGIVKNSDEMAQMTEIAITLGRAQGLDAATAVADLTTALARQSPMILDNLGITMKLSEAYDTYAASLGKTAADLTEQEKGEAFRMAALQKGMEVVEKMGGVQDDAAGAMERMNAQISNAKLLIGRELLPILTPLLEKITGLVTWFTNLDEGTRGLIVKVGLLVAAAGPFLVILGTIISSAGTVAGAIAGIGLPILPLIAIIVALVAAFQTNFLGIRDAVMPIIDAIKSGIAGFLDEGLYIGLENFLDALGIKPPPELWEFLEFIQDDLPKAIQELGAWFQDVWGDIQPIIADAVTAILGHLTKLQPIFDEVKAAIASAVVWVIENWPRIQEIIGTVLEVIRKIVVAVVGEVVPFITDMFGRVVDWVVTNWPLIKQTIMTVINAVWSVIRTVLGWIQTFWTAHGETILNVIRANWETLKTVIQTAIDVVLGIIRTVMQIINGDWAGAWETIRGIGETVWETIKEIITNAINMILGFFGTSLGELVGTWQEKFETVKTTASDIWTSIVTAIQGFLQGIVDTVTNLTQAAHDVIASIWTAIKDALTVIVGLILAILTGQWELVGEMLAVIWEKIKTAAETIWNTLKSAVTTIIETLSGWLSTTWENIRSAAVTAWERVKTGISDIISRLAGWLETTWDTIKGTAETVWENLKTAVAEKAQAVYDSVAEKIEAIKSFIKNFSLKEVGTSLIQGLIDGVKSMAQNLIDSVTGAIDDAIAAAKRLLGIESPSRVFVNIGRMTALGMAEGILSARGQVAAAVADVFGGTVQVAGMHAGKADERGQTIYDNSRTVNSQSNVTVNGMALGGLLSLAAEQV